MSGVLPARWSNIEKWVWALIQAIDIPRISRSGKAVSGGAVGAVRDFGAVHQRLVPGFVVDSRLDGDACVLTFANGMVAREAR